MSFFYVLFILFLQAFCFRLFASSFFPNFVLLFKNINKLEHQELTTVKTAKDLGLLPEEFDRIKEILGRVPNFTELSIFSVMWSEHCSYKNSITWLKTLPKDGPRMLAKAGEENAGLVDLGGGIGCAFKIESHNHPSALEPYQGAATGVGGINRDIFTMGARPIAQLNSLRFGDLNLATMAMHLAYLQLAESCFLMNAIT